MVAVGDEQFLGNHGLLDLTNRLGIGNRPYAVCRAEVVRNHDIGGETGDLLGDDLRRAGLASISPVTSETLRRLGFEPAGEASEYTMSGVVEAIARIERS